MDDRHRHGDRGHAPARCSPTSRRSRWRSPASAWIDGFTNAGVFVLLALGLNLVVGIAGLLDLGYAAFFAIGAYTYAYVASPFGNSIIGIPIVESLGTDAGGLLFWPMLLVGALVAATFGILLGAPTLRLRGDYLAIVTLGFGEIVPIVFLNSDAVTNGTNGIGGLLRPALPGIGSFSAVNPWPYYVTMLVLVTVVMILCYRLVESRLGPGLGGHPRGRAGGRGQRHQHRHHQAARLRARRVHRGHRRRVQRLEARHREPGPVHVHRVVHGARDGRPRRHGQLLGRRRGRVRDLHDQQRAAQDAQRVLRSDQHARSSRTSTSSSSSSCSTAWRWWR